MSQVRAFKLALVSRGAADVSTLCNRNSTSLMTDLSNVIHFFLQSCVVANHTIATGERAHILKATDWTSASQPTLKTDDSYLAFSNYDFKLIERNDKHILVGVAELMGMLQRRELLELVYENNTRVISIFFIICLSCTTYSVPLHYWRHISVCKMLRFECIIKHFSLHCLFVWLCACTGGFKGLLFSRSANLILNLASGRGNIGAELSSGGHIKPLVMNRDATRANTLLHCFYKERRREREIGTLTLRYPRSWGTGKPNQGLLIQFNPLASWKKPIIT